MLLTSHVTSTGLVAPGYRVTKGADMLVTVVLMHVVLGVFLLWTIDKRRYSRF